MKTGRRSVILALGVVIILLFSCSSGGENELQIEVSSISWFYENIDTAFWNPPGSSASLYGEFFIHYTGSDIEASDLLSATMSHNLSGGTWNFDLDSANIDTETQMIGIYPNRFHSTTLSSNGSVFPIGLFTFTVTLQNGNESSLEFDVPAPGLLTSNSMQYIYNEDYSGIIESNYTQMLKKASLGSTIQDPTYLEINFTINDSFFHDGWIWLYDNSETYIGISKHFREKDTGTITNIINNGSSINNNGTNNNVTLHSDDITFKDGYALSQAFGYAIVLTDGAQYGSTDSGYDCRSITAVTPF